MTIVISCQRLSMTIGRDTKAVTGKGKKLLKLRQTLGLGQSAFAKLLGVNQASIPRWENDQRPMPVAVLLKAATLAPPEQEDEWYEMAGIRGGIGHAVGTMSQHMVVERGFRSAPLVSDPAGAGRGALHESKNIEGQLSLPPDLVTGEVACVRVHGDSMEPLIPDRSVVAVDCLQVNARKLLGKVIAAQHDVEGVVVKRLRSHEGKLILVSENPIYPPIEFKPGWRIAGRVEWWIVRQR